ncbi:MAG TPA: hypothetical protein VHM31_17865 [Polyangia bacterium]|nr:hypothetical protein [Polyangia bacterium]
MSGAKGTALAAVVAGALMLATGAAHARDGYIIQGGRAPFDYTAEVEPHLVFGSAPPGRGAGSGLGVGVRASFVIAPDGFLRDVNDSVAIGVGLDYAHYAGRYALNGYRDQCLHFETGPAGTTVCTEVTSNGGSYNYLFVPVVMQWNFWLTEKFSAFAEGGLSLYHLGNEGFGAVPALFVGGRLRLTDTITLTARLGYPTISFGVSFML